jgi:hypothetical protein
VVRKDSFNDILDKNGHLRKFLTPSSFGKKIKYYCQFKGYHLNPNKMNRDEMEWIEFRKQYPDKLFHGEADKSAGVEFITIADNDYLISF